MTDTDTAAETSSIPKGNPSQENTTQALQWTAEQAFENLKFLDQKAGVLATGTGVIIARLFDGLANTLTRSNASVALVVALAFLLASFVACLVVLLPRGHVGSERSACPARAFVDADAAARQRGALNAQAVKKISDSEWIDAQVELIRDRGKNAKKKRYWLSIAIYTFVGAAILVLVGVVQRSWNFLRMRAHRKSVAVNQEGCCIVALLNLSQR